MSVPAPRRGRRRWSIAVLSFGLAAITIATVTLARQQGDEATAIAPHRVEPAAPSTAPSVLAQPLPPSPSMVNPQQARPPPGSAPVAPLAPDERVAPARVKPAAPVPDRGEPDTPSGAVAPWTAPQPPSTAVAREPAPHSQNGDDTVDVSVDSVPHGAQVVLDGAVLGMTPYHGTLPRDDREARLVLRLTGYTDKLVVARASQPIAEHVTLVRKAPAPAPSVKSPKGVGDRSVNPF